MFYLYVVVSSLTYINPIKPSLDDSCSPSMFHLRSFLLLGPHGRPMRLGARHVSLDFHPWEKRAKLLPPMGKSWKIYHYGWFQWSNSIYSTQFPWTKQNQTVEEIRAGTMFCKLLTWERLSWYLGCSTEFEHWFPLHYRPSETSESSFERFIVVIIWQRFKLGKGVECKVSCHFLCLKWS